MRVKKSCPLKPQLVTDGAPHMLAIRAAVPGQTPDKKLSAHLQPIERWPHGGEAEADKGSPGLPEPVSPVTVLDLQTGAEPHVRRLEVKPPVTQPTGQELTPEPHAFHTPLSQVRGRIAHGLGWSKHWAIIATRFRCAPTIDTALLCTVCGLVNAHTHRWQTAKTAYCA